VPGKPWVRSHPRKARGTRVHETTEERQKRIAQERGEEDTELAEFMMRAIGMAEQERPPELTLETIEERYLVPKVDHYVETEQVRKIKEKVKLWLSAGYPVHIIGPTGCGKSTLARRVAEELGKPTVWVNGDETMTTADLVGGYSKVETESLRDRFIHTVLKARDVMRAGWVDNPLTIACKYGTIFVYNDFSRAKPDANNVLLSVFQEGILELPTRFGEERYINVHPEFRAILTSNSVDYAGVHRPQDALLDRMVGVYMDFYDFDTEVKIVREHSGVSEGEAQQIVGAIRKLREKLPDAEKPGTRACIMIARGLVTSGGRLDELLEEFCVDILATKVKGPVDLAKKKQLVKEAVSAPIVGGS
jgi:nitric oxide reductase NorQ protein